MVNSSLLLQHADQQPSCVYGLRNQTRALCALTGEETRSLFLVGTLGLQGGGSDNELHVLEFDEEKQLSNANGGLAAAVFNHPHEIYSLSSCPSPEFKHIISTSYNVVGDRNHRFRSTLWKLDTSVIGNLHTHINTHRVDLEPMVSLDDKCSKTGICQIKFDPTGTLSKVVGRDNTQVVIYSLSEGLNKAMPSTQIPITKTHPILAIAWNPHAVGANLAVSHGPSVSFVDTRTSKVLGQINDTRWIRAVDYNPNKPNQILTGGDSGSLQYWDTRNVSQSIHQEHGTHSHWITNALYNPFHDQLVLSASTDHSVQVSCISSISAGPAMCASDSEDTACKRDDTPLCDGLVMALEYHEDSVYALAWSAADPWIFCSASYDGRLVVNYVPPPIKYKIIL